jgi:hypothetical protein
MQLLLHCAVFVIKYAHESLFGMFTNIGTSRQLYDQIIMSKSGEIVLREREFLKFNNLHLSFVT